MVGNYSKGYMSNTKDLVVVGNYFYTSIYMGSSVRNQGGNIVVKSL